MFYSFHRSKSFSSRAGSNSGSRKGGNIEEEEDNEDEEDMDLDSFNRPDEDSFNRKVNEPVDPKESRKGVLPLGYSTKDNTPSPFSSNKVVDSFQDKVEKSTDDFLVEEF